MTRRTQSWRGRLRAGAGVAAVLALGGLALSPGASAARATAPATVTSASGTVTIDVADPFPVVLASAGVPAAGQGLFTGSGYAPGTSVFVQVCDGVNPATTGWTPAAHCQEANAATQADSNGDVSINTDQASFEFEISHGEDGQDDQFNCLAPGDDPNGTSTVVGDQPIDNTLPSWGASTVGSAGGGTAPCQLRFGLLKGAYSTDDVYVPLTGLDATPSAVAPGAPGTPVVTPGPVGTGNASVSFSAPSSGGAPTSYKIAATDVSTSATVSATGPSSPIVVTGLTPGDSYTFTATAVNTGGQASSSASSAVLIPAQEAPGAPAAPTVTAGAAGSGSASVAFSPAASGGPVTSYTVTATDTTTTGPVVTNNGTASPIVVSGLEVGDTYTFTVTASNSGGKATSAASSPVLIPAGEAPGAPGKPVVSVGAPGSGAASVAFSAPTSGGAVTSYSVKASNLTVTSAPAVVTTGSASPIAVSGLTPGDSWSFTVTAVNASGSTASPASAGVLIPAKVAPTITGTAPAGKAGTAYRYQFTVKGVPTPTVSETGTLPKGLTLSKSGLLAGTPTKAGTFRFTVKASSSAGTATHAVELKVSPGSAAKVAVKAGNSQTAKERAAFKTKLEVVVTDKYGNVISGDKVTFKVTSGPATFPRSSHTATATTSSSGVATAPALTAGASTGTVKVTASVSGVRTAATFELKVVKS